MIWPPAHLWSHLLLCSLCSIHTGLFDVPWLFLIRSHHRAPETTAASTCNPLSPSICMSLLLVYFSIYSHVTSTKQPSLTFWYINEPPPPAFSLYFLENYRYLHTCLEKNWSRFSMMDWLSKCEKEDSTSRRKFQRLPLWFGARWRFLKTQRTAAIINKMITWTI